LNKTTKITAVYEQFWIKTGSKTPAETCCCQSVSA